SPCASTACTFDCHCGFTATPLYPSHVPPTRSNGATGVTTVVTSPQAPMTINAPTIIAAIVTRRDTTPRSPMGRWPPTDHHSRGPARRQNIAVHPSLQCLSEHPQTDEENMIALHV